MERFRLRRPTGWRALAREIDAAIDSVREHGYCWASWQPQVVAMATPVAVANHPVYVLNMSVTGDAAAADSVERLRGPLLDLAGRLREAVGNL
jgi:DNA-binding IclR family transcriptional regulator